MPFTISHAAAVLPLQRFGRFTLPLSALMVGSMAPDFGYFFSREISRQLTHSATGLFTFALPGGLIVWLFYVAVLEKTTITLLPDRWHTRFAHTDAITPALVGRATIAILLGAITHILWDAFTHQGTFITDAVPALLRPTPGFEWMPIYHLLQGLSSVVGIVVLGLWAHRLHRQPARSPDPPVRNRRNAPHGRHLVPDVHDAADGPDLLVALPVRALFGADLLPGRGTDVRILRGLVPDRSDADDPCPVEASPSGLTTATPLVPAGGTADYPPRRS